MWVFIETEPGNWTVGFYRASDVFVPESDHPTVEEAASRARYLNGGPDPTPAKRAKPPGTTPPPAKPK